MNWHDDIVLFSMISVVSCVFHLNFSFLIFVCFSGSMLSLSACSSCFVGLPTLWNFTQQSSVFLLPTSRDYAVFGSSSLLNWKLTINGKINKRLGEFLHQSLHAQMWRILFQTHVVYLSNHLCVLCLSVLSAPLSSLHMYLREGCSNDVDRLT